MDSMYERLRSLPLFQGVGPERISELVERLPFHFLKFKQGEVIINAGDRCKGVRFVVSGSVRIVMESSDFDVKLLQTLSAPEVLGPDSLFGIDNTYPFAAFAATDCGIMQLTKADYMKMLMTDKVFLFNILNYLSSNCQRHSSMLHMTQGNIAERLAREITNMTTPRSTDVVLEFRQKDLCTLLDTDHDTLVKAFDQMAAHEIITHSTSKIEVLDVRALQTMFYPD